MKKFDLNEFIGGWFIGNFDPSVLKSNNVEACIKRYNPGDYDSKHYHKEADEITVIVSGMVEMNHIIYNQDDIILIPKGEVTDFRAITAAVTCVVKIPCVIGDKYLTDKEVV